ncbi:MAG: hypothetical protein MZV63_66175 [Marinilabiliales bacterium]|nr:hypothetical protein [Marinilabiliales bacterium]
MRPSGAFSRPEMAALAVDDQVRVEDVPEEIVVEDHLLGDLVAGPEDQAGQLVFGHSAGPGAHPGDLRAHPVDDDLGGRRDGVLGENAGRLGEVRGDADELG